MAGDYICALYDSTEHFTGEKKRFYFEWRPDFKPRVLRGAVVSTSTMSLYQDCFPGPYATGRGITGIGLTPMLKIFPFLVFFGTFFRFDRPQNNSSPPSLAKIGRFRPFLEKNVCVRSWFPSCWQTLRNTPCACIYVPFNTLRHTWPLHLPIGCLALTTHERESV